MKTLHRSHGSGASKKYSHSKNWLLVHTQRHWCRFKHFLKPSVLHQSPCPRFELEFKVLLQMREPNSEGKVEILILGRRRYRKRAKRLMRILAQFSLETMKSFERENVHSDDFLSTAVMSSLDEAM
ncbi:unnamed protein product [Nyctereutes procyonoides]|uniref:(raccoon dog) hypothetical protein n=1 Tax=Nyctereutes procyonoides TaxID=34880 RepID=A0A811Z2H6_NYCPR|nr:unnamed protein product [Nyctereutes procyonoides]